MLQNITNMDSVIDTQRITVNCHNFDFPVFYSEWEMLAYTPLLLAILVKDISTVELLLDAGADINLPATIETKGGHHCKRPVIREAGRYFLLLLSKGANVNAPAAAYRGGTALQFAATHGDFKMVYKLLEKKADVNAPGAKFGGRTALEGAAEYGRTGVLGIAIRLWVGKRLMGMVMFSIREL